MSVLSPVARSGAALAALTLLNEFAAAAEEPFGLLTLDLIVLYVMLPTVWAVCWLVWLVCSVAGRPALWGSVVCGLVAALGVLASIHTIACFTADFIGVEPIYGYPPAAPSSALAGEQLQHRHVRGEMDFDARIAGVARWIEGKMQDPKKVGKLAEPEPP